MTGEGTQGASDTGELKETLHRELAELFGTEVRVRVYEQRDRLDIHVTPVELKRELEDRHDDITVTPYADFKLTVGRQDG